MVLWRVDGRMKILFLNILPLFAVVLAVAGCDRGPELATVSGKVTLNGQPLDEIRVDFLPDPEKGNVADTSTAQTDAEGRFVLTYSTNGSPGAAVGWHRVVLWDAKAINSRDNPIDLRISEVFSLAAKTPIRKEVKSGEQNIDLKLEDY